MGKIALITGITGQDGSYLAEFLLEKGYRVWGVVRRASTFSTARIDHLLEDKHESPPLRLIYGDMTDGACLAHILDRIQPDEVYNLAGQSHVRVSFDQPIYTHDVNALGTLRLLEAIRRKTGKGPRVYQASSSEMFGNQPAPQKEDTPFAPVSPYGVSKVAAHWHAVNYRESYGMYVACGILFNHESPRRGETFVTRKITRALGRIACGRQDKLYLGNIHAKRDWGYAPDYVRAMWLMLQQEEPGDYCIATGTSSDVQSFLEMACRLASIDWRDHLERDDRYLRPVEIHELRGDATKARKELGWAPRTPFTDIVTQMVGCDMRLARAEKDS